MGASGSDGRLGKRLLDGHVFAFAGGLPGSGTSLLVRALAAHPEASLLTGLTGTGADADEDEFGGGGQRLQDVLPPVSAYGGADRFALDASARLTEAATLATSENAERMLVQWAPFWDLDRPVLLEQSPLTLVRTRLLQALVPGGRFVLVVRHPVAVALSIRAQRRGVPFAGLLDHWFAAHDTLLADLPHLSAAQVVKYEHLVRDPGTVLARVADTLGLSGAIPADPVRGDGVAYQAHWDHRSCSRTPWRRAEYRRLVDRYEARARRVGYTMTDLTAAEPFPLPGGVQA